MKSDNNALSKDLDSTVEGKVSLYLIGTDPTPEHFFFEGGLASNSAET